MMNQQLMKKLDQLQRDMVAFRTAADGSGDPQQVAEGLRPYHLLLHTTDVMEASVSYMKTSELVRMEQYEALQEVIAVDSNEIKDQLEIMKDEIAEIKSGTMVRQMQCSECRSTAVFFGYKCCTYLLCKLCVNSMKCPMCEDHPKSVFIIQHTIETAS